MRKLFVVLTLLIFMSVVFADENYTRRYSGYPEGVFKKSRNGKIVQYDNNGKKIGVYNIGSGKYVKR